MSIEAITAPSVIATAAKPIEASKRPLPETISSSVESNGAR